VTPPITYKLEIDTARDGTFSQAIDDITQYWIGQATWNNGMGGSYDEVAPPARLTVQLSNRSGDFDRDIVGSELIVNGGFDDWTGNVPDGWTFYTDEITAFVTQVAPDEVLGGTGLGAANIFSQFSNSRVYLTQNILQNNKTYLVTFNITAVGYLIGARGEITYLPGIAIKGVFTSNDYFSTPVGGEGTYRYIVRNLTGNEFTIGNYILNTVNATIDNVSVKETAKYAMVNKGMQVRLRATYNGATNTLFQGRISQIQPSAGNSTEKTVSITIEDAMLELLDAEYAPPLLTAPTADVALQRMFDDAVIRWPYSGSWWLLGIGGYSELNYTTYLYDHDVTDFETGITTFEYLGDVEDRGAGISAQGYVRDVIAGEAGGRFWFNTRTNKFKFVSRDHDPLNDTIAATYNESNFDSVTPKYGEDIVNDLTLSYTSRDVGSEGTVLWSLKSIPFLLKNNTKRIFNARYFDVNNEQLNVGARTTLPPVAGTDYTANIANDGSGTNYTDRITVAVEAAGNSAKVSVFNNSGIDLYITLLQLRGTPITQIEERYQSVAGDSIAANELYPKVIEVRALDNTSLAEQFGDYIVAKFKDPIFRFETATFNSLNGETMIDASVNRVIGDKITITDASTNHDKDYIIVGEQHSLIIAGDHPRDVTWILKPAARESFWVLEMAGKSELDLTTRLSF
jgi:hypothetical protein